MNSKLDFLTYFEYRVHAALFRAMEGWLFAKWCWNQHICFTGLNHCVFSTVLTNLGLTRWPEEAYFLYFFLALQRFFFYALKGVWWHHPVLHYHCHTVWEKSVYWTLMKSPVQCACLCQVLHRAALMFCGRKHHLSCRSIDYCTFVSRVTINFWRPAFYFILITRSRCKIKKKLHSLLVRRIEIPLDSNNQFLSESPNAFLINKKPLKISVSSWYFLVF